MAAQHRPPRPLPMTTTSVSCGLSGAPEASPCLLDAAGASTEVAHATTVRLLHMKEGHGMTVGVDEQYIGRLGLPAEAPVHGTKDI